MKTTIKILIFLFLLFDNITFAQPNIEYSMGVKYNYEYDGKTSIDFGDFQIGSSTEGYGFITIFNTSFFTSNSPLEILSIDIEGDFSINYDADDWTVYWHDDWRGKHTPPIETGNLYRFDVSFSPTALGTRIGTLKIYHNASNYPSPITINLTGNGVNNGTPLLDQYGFNSSYVEEIGPTAVGYGERSIPMTIRNKGNAPLNISCTITGDEGFYFVFDNSNRLPIVFELLNDTVLQLQPRANTMSSHFYLEFVPTLPGPHSCTLAVYHDAPNFRSPITKRFTANAVAHLIETSSTDLDFGSVDIGSSFKKSIKFTNYGIDDFVILSYEVFGGVFTVLNQLPIKMEGILGENNDDLIVQFTPTAARTYTGIINLTGRYGSPYLPYTRTFTWSIPLSGTGTNKELFIEEPLDIPTAYNLEQNYPNPFNPTTKIEYSLPEATMVRLAVYNSLGQEVASLVNEYKAAGKYIVDFNANNLPSGMYFYKLQSGNFNSIKKMMLIK